jgi:cation diffusion facilitator family transporter
VRVLVIVLGLNALVASIKLVVGFHIGALSLVADGIHSVLDGSSNVVALVGLKLAATPPDRNHPYGHRRFETIAAVAIGLLIGAAFVEVATELVHGLFGEREPVQLSWWSAAVVLATIVANLFISTYEGRASKHLSSELLEADSKHTLTDAIAASAVLMGFGGLALGAEWADLAAAAAVSGFIAHTAWGILRSNLGILTDEARLDPRRVYDVALSVEGVRGAHKIRSRGTRSHVLVDMHVHLDPGLPLGEAHALTHRVVDALQHRFPEIHDVVIHAEPADGREKDRTHLAPGREERQVPAKPQE